MRITVGSIFWFAAHVRYVKRQRSLFTDDKNPNTAEV